MATRTTLNWRFILVTTIALFVTAGVIYFWHNRQVRTQTGAYLHQANLARDKNEQRREIEYLERYLRVQPRSNEARERLARLYAKTARSPRQIEDAFYLLEDCLRRQPDHDDLRTFTVDYAMEPRTSLILEVVEHLDYLIAKYPENAEYIEQMGRYLAAKLDFQGARREFQKSYELQRDRFNAYAGHALIERDRLNNPERADEVIGQMIDRNKENFRAHLYAFEYGRKYRVPQMVSSGIQNARSLAPDNLDVIVAFADWRREEARRLRTIDSATASTWLGEARAELQRGALFARANLPPGSAPPEQAVTILLMQAAIEAEWNTPLAAAKILTDALPSFPGNIAILTSLVDYQIRADDLAGADATFAALEKLDVAPARLAYDRARLTFAKRNWLAAARELQHILDEQPSDPAFIRSVNYLLGRCYEQIGENDRRLAAFTRAIPDDVNDPLWVLAQFGQADAYASLGRADDALRTYIKLADRTPDALLGVARLRILQALRSADPTAINWAPANEAVQKCLAALPDSIDAKLVHADSLALQKREAEAKAIIDPLFDSPKQRVPAVWIAKAFSISRESNAAEGIALLERGRAELGDPVELRLAQAQLLAQTKEGKPESKLLALSEGIDRYRPADRRRLLRGLAETATASVFIETGGILWDQIVQANPDDLSAHLVRFDRACRTNDEAAIMRIRDEIKRIDGDAGVSTRVAKAFTLIWKEQRTKDRAGLDEAMNLLNRLESERPGWSRITLGKALIFDRQEKTAAALTHYRKAVDQGESQPEVLRRLINLLAARGQFDEANAVLNRLQNDELGSPDAMRLAADVSLRADNPARALALAAKAVPPDSKNHEDFLWKGRLLWAAQDHEGARTAFGNAHALKPDKPDAWLLLIETLMFDNRKGEAESVFRDAKGKVRDDDNLLFTAQAHKLLGQKVEAQRAFEQARGKRPNNLDVLRAEADFLMSDAKMDEACEAWTRVIKLSSAPEGEREFAKNMLAICLALNPDYAKARTAVTTLGLDQKAMTASESSISKRTQAVVLALQRERSSKLQAIRIFENLREELSDNDRFLLAQWYFQVDDERQGRMVMANLLSRPPADRNSLFLSYYAGFLLARGELKEVGPWIAKLEKIDPNAIQTIELKVQMLAGLRNTAAARAILKEQAEKPNARLRLLAIIAEGAGLDADAESLYKRFMESERGKTPDLDLLLAGFYARRGRLNEALAICEKAWKTCSPAAVGQLCIEALSATPQADPAILQRVAGWIEDARSKNPNLAPPLLMQLAFVRNLQGQFDEAIRIYQQLSTAREPDLTVLNNLAFLLSAHRKEHAQALLVINRAKEKGPLPDLLDTEALILMAMGKPDHLVEARKLLKHALDQSPSGSLYFHLAQIEDKAGNRDDSLLAWRDAQRLKLKARELHPLERPAFEEMARTHR